MTKGIIIMTANNAASIIKSMVSTAGQLATEETGGFHKRSDLTREIGQGFRQLMAGEGGEAKPNPTYDKWADQLKAVLPKTTMVNVAYELAMLTDAEYRRVRKAFEKNGIQSSTAKKDRKRVRLIVDELGRAAKGWRDDRYSLTTGVLKPSNRGGGGKSKKARIAEARAKSVAPVAEAWGEDFDVSHFETDELELLKAAVITELRLRAELGATVVH